MQIRHDTFTRKKAMDGLGQQQKSSCLGNPGLIECTNTVAGLKCNGMFEIWLLTSRPGLKLASQKLHDKLFALQTNPYMHGRVPAQGEQAGKRKGDAAEDTLPKRQHPGQAPYGPPMGYMPMGFPPQAGHMRPFPPGPGMFAPPGAVLRPPPPGCSSLS